MSRLSISLLVLGLVATGAFGAAVIPNAASNGDAPGVPPSAPIGPSNVPVDGVSQQPPIASNGATSPVPPPPVAPVVTPPPAPKAFDPNAPLLPSLINYLFFAPMTDFNNRVSTAVSQLFERDGQRLGAMLARPIQVSTQAANNAMARLNTTLVNMATRNNSQTLMVPITGSGTPLNSTQYVPVYLVPSKLFENLLKGVANGAGVSVANLGESVANAGNRLQNVGANVSSLASQVQVNGTGAVATPLTNNGTSSQVIVNTGSTLPPASASNDTNSRH